eukprot:1609426-Amphidinium_carterae.1
MSGSAQQPGTFLGHPVTAPAPVPPALDPRIGQTAAVMTADSSTGGIQLPPLRVPPLSEYGETVALGDTGGTVAADARAPVRAADTVRGYCQTQVEIAATHNEVSRMQAVMQDTLRLALLTPMLDDNPASMDMSWGDEEALEVVEFPPDKPPPIPIFTVEGLDSGTR